MENAFASWSGGKDCSLACYRAINSGIKVKYLLNMVSEDSMRSRSHGVSAKTLQMQAEAMGIQLVQQPAGDNYESQFKAALAELSKKGVTAGVFGDIDFNEHKEWIDRVCASANITPHLPLWLENQDKLMKEFIALGFIAIVVATKDDILGEEWLGRKIDQQFLADLAKLKNVTPCGEAGEYHSLVIDGPLFKKRMEILETSKNYRMGRSFLDITHCELKPKK